MQKINQKEFRVEKVIKRKGNKLYVTWKDDHSSFNNWIDKKDVTKMIELFPESNSSGRVKIELDLSIYTTKADLKMPLVLIHKNLLKRLI